MFTGIVETIGHVAEISRRGEYKILYIKPESMIGDISPGESVAVDGCCLTVTEIVKDGFMVEVSPESAAKTILGAGGTGRTVNLERALLPSTRLGGHIVTGHIDVIGTVTESNRRGNIFELRLRIPGDFLKMVVEKGSIAINGVSLTINNISGDTVGVNLIPFTRRVTTLDGLKAGEKVNVEFDIIGKYVIRLLGETTKENITWKKLSDSGW